MIGLPSEHQEDSLVELLHQARNGSVEALGQLLETCRVYLLVVARQELRAPLHAKVDAADLVQETFIEATRDFARFHGETEAQLLSWLRGILRHNLTDLMRHFATGCRSVSQEVPLHHRLADLAPTNSEQGEATNICEQLIAQERLRALDAALERLPPCYRQVVQLRYEECYSFAEIGNSLQRSPDAVRKLLCRVLERLRRELGIFAEV